MHKKFGFTLLEIIIATIILALTVLGLLGVFVAGNNWVLHLRERSTSAELGKLLVDPLQKAVRQDTWNLGSASNALTPGITYCDNLHPGLQNINCPPPSVPGDQRVFINGKPFDITYTADPVALSEVRRVLTVVHWDEAATKP